MTLAAHPYADKFPMLPEGELEELAESIRANGLRSPIVVTPDGQILDGRNRAAACERIGATPETVIYEGDDLAEYVIDCNVTRRNMTTGARAMSTALVLESAGRRENGRWKRGSVDISAGTNSSWRDRIAEAGTVLDWIPDVAERVISGDIPLKVAYAQACDARDKVDAEKRAKAIEANRKREATIKEKEDNDRKLAALADDRSRFLASVQDGSMTIAVAYAAHREATRKEREQAEADRLNAEQTIRVACEALAGLSIWSYPEARARTIAAYRDGHGKATRPSAIEWHTPTNIRRIAAWINTYATELEESK